MEINAELISGIRKFLTEDGINFFKNCKNAHGSLSPILKEVHDNLIIYYPVHFIQGTQIRAFMNESGLCENWTEPEIFQHWTMVVDMAIA